MAAKVKLELDGRFVKMARGSIEKYDFEVGILRDRTHFRALPKSKGLTGYAGGPARRTSRKPSGMTVAQVSEEVRRHVGKNFYTRPFRKAANQDLAKFKKVFFDFSFGRATRQECETALVAVVRNPILRGEYGRNKPQTAKAKGFNRLLIDTAQVVKAIEARVSKRG